MDADLLEVGLYCIIFFVYGSIAMISLMFAFSLEEYQKLDDKLCSELFSLPVVTILDRSFEWIDLWMARHNKIVGIFLAMLSIVDMKLYFNLLNKF